MRGRNPIGFRPRFLWSGVGVPDFIIFDIVLNRLRLGKLGTSARFLSAFTIFAEDGRRFGNLCVQARTIALTFHYLCRVSWVRILFANGDPISRDSRLGIERFGTSRLGFLPKCGDCLQDVINGKTMRYFIELRYNGGAYCGWQRQPDMPSLKEGRLAGAAVDVFETEPPISPEHPLLQAPNLLATPHVAFATKEALYKRAVIVFENISGYLEGRPQNVM